jgi:hypothetical protein
MIRIILKSFICILFAYFGFSLESNFSKRTQVEQILKWNEVVLAYDAFLSCPSLQNAKVLAKLLPINHPDKAFGDEGQALDYIFSAENFGVLVNEAEAGNRYSLETLVRLLNFTDGFSTEEVLGVLRRIVRTSPGFFLEVLFENYDILYIKRFGVPVAYPAYAYNNHPGAYKYDLEKRIESLESINNSKYAWLKNACIKKLNEEIGQLK